MSERTTNLTMSLAIKLASLAVHAEEATGPEGHSFDMSALRGISEDAEVVAWLREFDPALLPVKRQSTASVEREMRTGRGRWIKP